MKFCLTRVPPGRSEIHPNGCWIVEKVLQDGERYLIGCWDAEHKARACLVTLSHSIECSRGAEVEGGSCGHRWVTVVPAHGETHEACADCGERRAL